MSLYKEIILLNRLKNFINKSYVKKTFRLDFNGKLNIFQKLTYLQREIIRKYSTNNMAKEKKNSATSITVEDYDKKKRNVFVDSLTRKSYYFSQAFTAMLQNLGSKIKKTSPVAPKQKTNLYSNTLKNSTISRTKLLLQSIATTESNISKWNRVEDLLIHLEQFPEAKHYAVKEGAIKILLKTSLIKNDQLKGTIRQALAVLGYVDCLPGRGIRILSIDGGGIRGVLVIEMLKKLEELTGKRVHEMFDYICGVSTGAILSAVLAVEGIDPQGGHKRKTLQDISKLYKDLSTKIFTQGSFRGTSNLVWSHAYYDTALWEKMLKENLGEQNLIQTTRNPITPKFSAISAVVNLEQVMAYVFRNYAIPIRTESQYIGSYKHKIWEAIRASAAAPTYFEEFKCGDLLHQDGGIMVNNPCAVAIHEAIQLWPNRPIQCVISFGTGRKSYSIDSSKEKNEEAVASSWKNKFYKILHSATDTEAVHITLNDLLPDHVYYRFNPYLTEMLAMEEIRPEKILQLEQDAAMYIRRNEEKFYKAAKMLIQKKTLTQSFIDWIKFNRTILGIQAG